jgi:putative Holliday junction resolvase
MNRAPDLLLAFDFGLKRIGVASGNRLTQTATPVTTLIATDVPPWSQVDALIAEWGPDILLVGDPGEGCGDRLGKALGEFVAGLRDRHPLPVELVDESFSSVAAEDALRTGRQKGIYNRRLSKGHIDSEAACLIAEQWMNEKLEHA